jgi:hypothetical protein
MKRVLAALALLLTGCAHQDTYTTDAVVGDPKELIEHVLTAQPRRYRPTDVEVTDKYMQYSGNTYSKGPALGVGHSVEKQDVVRVYYVDIAENRLYSKGRWWIVHTVNKQGSRIATIWSDDREAAVRYISALETMRDSPAR